MRPPLFGLGLQGKSVAVTAKRLLNTYLEFRPQGEKVQVCAFGTAGLDLFSDAFGDTPHRGPPLTFEPGNVFFTVHRGVFWEVNNSAVRTNRGSLLTTTGTVSMAHNGTQVLIVDGAYGYIYNTSTLAFTQIVAAGFPSNPLYATFLDGFFIVNRGNTGQFNISGLYDGTLWSALDAAVTESNPDNLVRPVADHGQLVLFGDISTEFWTDTGALSFPFARIQLANVEWGLAAANSVVKFDNSLAFLAANRMGQYQVVRLNGFQPQRISNSDLEYVISNYGVASDATGLSYLQDGHPFYQLSFPSAGYSWLFDGSTGKWSELKSANITRHRGQYAMNFLGRTVVTDYSNGRLYKFNSTSYTDNGEMIEREIIGEHWDDSDLARVPIDQIRMDMETGVGLVSGQGSNPQIMLQCSKDRGHTWGTERWKTFGGIGAYKTTVEWMRWGQSRNWTFRLRVTDPVKLAVLGVVVNPGD